jgi:transcription elongation factor Elf1
MEWSVICPRCGAANEDPFEVMTRDDVDWTTCGNCRTRFFFLATDCEQCEHEAVFAWPAAPAPEEMRNLSCWACGSPVGRCHETPLSGGALFG